MQIFRVLYKVDNIKESWPRDIVKESENVSGQKSEEGSKIKVTGEYMGKRDEMLLGGCPKRAKQKTSHKTNGGSVSKKGKHTRVSKHWRKLHMS